MSQHDDANTVDGTSSSGPGARGLSRSRIAAMSACMPALALCASMAAADSLEVYFEGTILSGSAQGESLAGKEISGRFVFDPALAPPDSFTEEDDASLLSLYRGDYLRNPATEFQWISSAFTIDGRTFRSPTDILAFGAEGVQVLDFISIACECYDQYIVYDFDSGPGVSHSMSFNFLRFLGGPGNFLDGGQEIGQPFRVDEWGSSDWRIGSVSHCSSDDAGGVECTSASVRLDRIQAAPLGVRAVEALQDAFADTPGLSQQAGLVGVFLESGNTTAACAILGAMDRRVSSLPDAQSQRESIESARRDIGCPAG